jgi:hypothetical protein
MYDQKFPLWTAVAYSRGNVEGAIFGEPDETRYSFVVHNSLIQPVRGCVVVQNTDRSVVVDISLPKNEAIET